jgi:non-ribosomal peptide synthetase-like protein
MDRSLTHDPGPLRFANRIFWETLRFAVPALPSLLMLCWLTVVGGAISRGAGAAALVLIVAPTVTIGAAALLCAAALAAKWALLGRVRPGQHGLWSGWANRWDFLYVVCERYARPVLSMLEGTLLLNWYHRAMGASIGKRVVLGGGFAQVLDPDMLHLEDDATVDCMFQAHSFEDRVLKIDHVFVRSGATAGHASVLLYGADVGAGAQVAPNSVVMKHERLLPHGEYAGAPTVNAAG